MKPLKRIGWYKNFLDFDRRAVVTFGPPTRTVKGKLPHYLIKRVPKAHPKENQPNQQQQASEANRRVVFNKETEVRTLPKGNKQNKSKQQPGIPTTSGKEELQLTACRYDKKFQDLVEEVNTKRRLGYKIIEDSDRRNNLKVLYQQTVHLLGEKHPNHCSVKISVHLTQQVSLKNI